ncbi:MAG: 2TM domain-containing protein [Anaerolineae bacterium]|nr:2TM domain-containing protein [Anaerolineae bacterium]
MSEPNYDEIRERITDRYNNRIGFYSHLISFLIINGLGWGLWLATPEMARSGILSVLLLISSAGWLVGMLIHALIYGMTEARDRAIERAIAAERGWDTGEKPKRDPRVRLTIDGELEEIDDDEADYTPAPEHKYRQG